MTDPTAPATIARLRELIAVATPLPWCCCDFGHLECREIGDIGNIELHAPTSPFTRAESKDDAALIVEAVNVLPAILDQLDAQAEEIERMRGDLDTAKRDAEEAKAVRNGMHVKNFAAMRDAQARVAELTALIRSIYAQDVEDDQQSPVEDLLRHQAREYGKARCRVRELERELAATVKAKQENDERFMIERDEARGRVKELECSAVNRLDLLADCLEQIGLRDERGLWDGALSTAEDLIDHLVEAGRLVRVPGDGPARWEWVGMGAGR